MAEELVRNADLRWDIQQGAPEPSRGPTPGSLVDVLDLGKEHQTVHVGVKTDGEVPESVAQPRADTSKGITSEKRQIAWLVWVHRLVLGKLKIADKFPCTIENETEKMGFRTSSVNQRQSIRPYGGSYRASKGRSRFQCL